jgi:metal-responsive CopG/Arc/MetJ family transcriptional regulator
MSTVRQTFTLPADLIKKVDDAAAVSKRSRNGMVEVLLEQAIREREKRFQKYKEVQKKILAAGTDEEAAQYDEELLEAIFGPQKRSAKKNA